MYRYEIENILGDFKSGETACLETDFHFEKKYENFSGNAPGVIPYRYYVPENSKEEKHPVLLFMHGAGERGCDNGLQLRTALHVLAEKSPEIRDFIIIAPQCPGPDMQWVYTPWMNISYSVDGTPESWQIKTVLRILDELTDRLNGDRDRTYVMGISMGGYATWDIIMRHGERFAAAVPICGGADPSKAEILKDIPIKTYHGALDGTVPPQGTRDVVSAVKADGGKKISYTEYPNVYHDSWDLAASDEGLGKWLLSNRVSDRIK